MPNNVEILLASGTGTIAGTMIGGLSSFGVGIWLCVDFIQPALAGIDGISGPGASALTAALALFGGFEALCGVGMCAGGILGAISGALVSGCCPSSENAPAPQVQEVRRINNRVSDRISNAASAQVEEKGREISNRVSAPISSLEVDPFMSYNSARDSIPEVEQYSPRFNPSFFSNRQAYETRLPSPPPYALPATFIDAPPPPYEEDPSNEHNRSSFVITVGKS
jgi:hypothetical protein